MNLLNKLRLSKQYTFDGTIADLVKEFEQIENLRVERVGHNIFKLRPFVSYGTLIVWGLGRTVDGINVTATLTQTNENKQRILFTTKVRPEHLFIVIIFPFFMFIIIWKEGRIEELAFVFGLWLVFHLWFQFVYRVQEKMVIEKVVDQFELTEN